MTSIPIQRLAFLLAAVALMAVWRPHPAQAAQCYDSDGVPRECTFTENIGECYWNADDSLSQCLQRARSYWDEVLCTFAWEADYAACGVDTMGRFALQLLSDG